MDENVYFLELLEMSFKNLAEPIPVYRYDERFDTIQRYFTLKKFSTDVGPRIMLATRSTAGHGLDILCADVLIRCGPWYTAASEEQALGRVHRLGQHEPVVCYDIRARGCKVEEYKQERKESKKRSNMEILKAIEKMDGAQLYAPRHIS